MSYLMHTNGTRIVDDYPKEATGIHGVEHDLESEQWRAIPPDSDLTEWMRIIPYTRRATNVREHRVFYSERTRPPPRPNAPWSVTISLYGFIESMNLSLTGNWDSKEENAFRAHQWVRLCGGHRPSTFEAQGTAFSNIEQHIIGTLRGGGLAAGMQESMLAQRKKSLYLSRRVFEKVVTGSPDSLPVTGPAAQIVNKWRITSTTKVGLRRDDLKIQSCSSAKLAPGDFVQAQVKFSVVAKDAKPQEPPRVFVNLELLSIFRLVSARDSKTMMPADVQAAATSASESLEVAIEESIDIGPEMV